MAERWRPIPQPPCEPGCTCHLPSDAPVQLAARDTEPLRECGVTGCTSCNEVYRWIERTDPDPSPPPGGGDRLPYGTKGNTNGYQH